MIPQTMQQIYRLTEDGQQKWHHFTNETSGKLTVILQTVQSSSVDDDLHLFKLNEDTITFDYLMGKS